MPTSVINADNLSWRRVRLDAMVSALRSRPWASALLRIAGCDHYLFASIDLPPPRSIEIDLPPPRSIEIDLPPPRSIEIDLPPPPGVHPCAEGEGASLSPSDPRRGRYQL